MPPISYDKLTIWEKYDFLLTICKNGLPHDTCEDIDCFKKYLFTFLRLYDKNEYCAVTNNELHMLLLYSIHSSSFDITSYLLTVVDLDDINKPNEMRDETSRLVTHTLLSLAVAKNDTQTVQLLLQQPNIDKNCIVTTDKGETAFFYCCE